MECRTNIGLFIVILLMWLSVCATAFCIPRLCPSLHTFCGSQGDMVQCFDKRGIDIYSMAYSPSGVVDTKYSPETGTDIIFGYTQGYNNATFYTHQPQIAYSSTEEDIMMFRWDWNGQLTHIGRPYTEQFRRHVWNEAGQLAAVFGNEYCGYYAYDAQGNRAYKLTGSVVVDQYNGGYIYASAYFDEATMYVNPYMVVTRRGYTKHYYNGSQRIASRLGDNLGDGNTFVRDDDLTALLDTAKSLWNNMTYVWEPSHQDMQDDEQFIDVAGNSLPIHRYGPYIGEINSCLYDADIFSYVFWGDFHLTDDTGGDGLFFYHSDHLGSANWVTNSQGQAVQYIHYMPFGELWENQQAFEYDERFKFTGKERDSETGYDYFGARYYLSLLGIWLSPDPLLDKYPHISSYAYVENNPIKYIDPNGKEKYNFLNPNGKDYNLFWASENYVDNIPSIHIWAHGSNQSMKLYDIDTGQETLATDALMVVDFLNEKVFPNSNAWKKHTQEGTQAVVVLHACETGQGDNSIAQNLSELLPNTLVIAPNENVAVSTKGENSKEIGSYKTKQNSSGKIVSDGVGTWRMFRNGKEIGSFAGTSAPNIKNPEKTHLEGLE